MKAQSKTERKNSALVLNIDNKKEMREEERVTLAPSQLFDGIMFLLL